MAAKRSSASSQLVLGLLVVVGLFWLGGVFSSKKPAVPPTEAEVKAQALEDLKLSARGACRIALENSLNDPGSAEWEPGYTWLVVVTGPDLVHVEPVLRAKNGFGALMKIRVMCDARLIDEQWHIERLEQVDP